MSPGPPTCLPPAAPHDVRSFMDQAIPRINRIAGSSCFSGFDTTLSIGRCGHAEFRSASPKDPCGSGGTHLLLPVVDITHPIYRFIPPTTANADNTGLVLVDIPD